MNIVAIREIFKLQSAFHLPKHKDFTLLNWSDYLKSNLYGNEDAFIQTNIKGKFKAFSLNPFYDHIANSGKPFLVLEQSVFRKNVDTKNLINPYYRLGLNSYTYDKGIFKNENSPPDRWKTIQERCQIEIKPWRDTGDYILLLLQNPEDTSLNNLKTSYKQWIENTVREISKHTSEDIVIRLHPCFIYKYNVSELENIKVPNKIIVSGKEKRSDVTVSHGGSSFQEDMDGARVVVSFSSNGLQEAVCEGIPTVSMDTSSFSWPVSYHSLDILSEKNIKCEFERNQWLYDCSYCQWTLDELDSGYPHMRLLKSI